MIFKKIAVCHGKVCGPAGAEELQKILEKEYGKKGVEVGECTCCGRCEQHNSVVIDDTVIVSHLSPKNVFKKFIADPKAASEEARQAQRESEKKLENALSDDLLL